MHIHMDQVRVYALAGLLAAAAVVAFFIFKPFLIPLALAAIFAVVLQPIYRMVLRATNGWRRLGAALTIILVTMLVLVPLGFITARVLGEAQNAYSGLTQGGGLANTQGAIIFLGQSMEPHIPGSLAYAMNISNDLNGYITNGLGWLLDNASVAFAGALGFLLSLFIFYYALFSFLLYGPQISAGLRRLSPFPDSDDDHILGQLTLTVNSVVRGSLTIAVLQGIVAGIGYVIFSVPNPLLWGVATAMASLVPAIGTGAVLIPAVLYLLMVGDVASAIGLGIWGIAAVGLIDNFLSPVLIGRGAKLPALVILLSVLGGLAFFGPAGIFLGPLTISLLLALFGLYTHASAAEEEKPAA
jgi:predicted PurR-regulated permease PerM